MLELKNVQKSYQSNNILNIPHLLLPNGIYWVKGDNGTGKTTLLKMIAGLLSFNGDIICEGTSIKRQPLAYRQQVSWAEAEPLYPAFMTGMQLALLYQSIRKVPKPEIDQLIAVFNIGGYIHHSIGTYSAGMTKKLSLMLAFIGYPRLIILDEPFITLDTDTLERVCNYILDSHQKKGCGFLMSSHQEVDMRLPMSGMELTLSNQTLLQTA